MQWWEEYYRDVDSGQLERFSRWYADDIVSRFGNMPVTQGKAELLASLGHFFQNFEGLSHAWNPVVGNADVAMGEGVCTYHLKDGRRIAIPVVTVIERREDGLIHRSSVYFDVAPLFTQGTDAVVPDPHFFIRKHQAGVVRGDESRSA
jgi:ketosteroid isomerase-like protein